MEIHERVEKIRKIIFDAIYINYSISPHEKTDQVYADIEHQFRKIYEQQALAEPSSVPQANELLPHVRASALIKRFSEWNKKYPKGRIYSINSKDGMDMMRKLDELAEEAQDLNKHLP